MDFISMAFQSGGFIMYVILAFLIGAVVLGMWRIFLLFFVFDTQNAAGIWSELQKYVTNNQLEQAIRTCGKYPPKQILTRILKKGLQTASRTAEETHYAVDSTTRERLPLCNRYLNWFGVIANVTTLLGLLGTIMGLIRSFSAVGTLSGAQKQTMLAEGISHALYATGFGLGTALLATVLHGVLTTKSAKLSEQIEEYSAKLVELLQNRRNNLSVKTAGNVDHE